MNKQELITSITEKTGLSKKDSELALKAYLESVEEALIKGEKVQLVGFGTFELRDRKERECRNPQKPEEKITIPACKAVAFKVGKKLKQKVNQ